MSTFKFKQILGACLIGFLAYVILICCAEFACGILNKARKNQLKESSGFSQSLYSVDPVIGYKPKPNTETFAFKEVSAKPLYRVKYTTDTYSRRIAPMGNPEIRDKFILFFGGSIPFGEGVNDEVTLPAFMARFASEYYPYNYSCSGYGPQEMLAHLGRPEFKKEISQKDGVAIYFLHDGDVSRAIGSMVIYNAWGRTMPYYQLRDGQLIRRRDFRTGRPWLSRFYSFLGKSQILKYFKIDLPPRIRFSDVKLVAKILERSRDLFKEKFKSNNFFVIILPEQKKLGPKIIPYFKTAGIQYLDYSSWNLTEKGLRMEYDGHPTPKGYALMAGKLATDLKILKPEKINQNNKNVL
ncbi:MAG: hypothetical protein A3G33_09545 [Omnitrophica bacterium RIFCSPLOWO2_12_FULL_44_17]|uniref:Uncharacterized protein n=1 Tax=Candidatus Danuiimicrobium aquiferis TaxID=1801832 RepID=A0A1G1KX36_9BACT|nr:MAG: hypothetical protein A3B72_09815 [Omnitrophica bacterium RIFCSPHIGHO2_02_FULL_45_28]OGW89619.1 MAG: hypothetical protein A3E74_04990 [Omnitrophica bacterium RIFCSPHIGHO2_12_FULL_44_12]OGW97425.1 MAG: hypothetical protein A3G33_09545 [Omnitrophica bacterium RIFCSPLOWO2_12_FULL_44_17]OGX04499.1 MAG: hypothetical protein A3J12_10585 [Omnitrophica bacterium RIFCSPLOWO2_02_FULL_44_11]